MLPLGSPEKGIKSNQAPHPSAWKKDHLAMLLGYTSSAPTITLGDITAFSSKPSKWLRLHEGNRTYSTTGARYCIAPGEVLYRAHNIIQKRRWRRAHASTRPSAVISRLNVTSTKIFNYMYKQKSPFVLKFWCFSTWHVRRVMIVLQIQLHVYSYSRRRCIS